MRSVTDKMKRRQQYLILTAEKIRKELSELPSGSIRISKSHGHFQYYYIAEKHAAPVYIRKTDHALARDLVRKRYLEKALDATNEEANAIGSYLKAIDNETVESVYEQLGEAYKKQTVPIVESDEDFAKKWSAQPYEKKTNCSGETFFIADSGDCVRSKAELIIDNMLSKHGIMFRYECGLMLSGRMVYPDFTLLDIENRREIYWEHFGMMDEPDYARKTIKKIKEYEANGFVLGERLIATFEVIGQPINTAFLERTIERLKKTVACVKAAS